MTLELLFAQPRQGHTFLLMVLCGLALGAGILLAGWVHRRNRPLGMAADLLIALLAAAATGAILLQSGEGLRLYALLGLCIGGAVYAAGIGPLFRWLADTLCRPRRPKGDSRP